LDRPIKHSPDDVADVVAHCVGALRERPGIQRLSGEPDEPRQKGRVLVLAGAEETRSSRPRTVVAKGLDKPGSLVRAPAAVLQSPLRSPMLATRPLIRGRWLVRQRVDIVPAQRRIGDAFFQGAEDLRWVQNEYASSGRGGHARPLHEP
jgi:hypothetical protein